MSVTPPMPSADPAPAPEWAVEAAFAHTFPADYNAYGYAKARVVWAHLEGTSDWRRLDTLARLLATLRERTLREAAGVCGKRADEFNRLNVEGGMGKAKSYQHGQEAMACGGAILSLIAQPPKPERSDGSEAEGREEA